MQTSQKIYDTNEQNKIYILGGRGVGKTSLFNILFSGKFDENISPSEKGIAKSNLQNGKNIFTIKDLTDDESFEITKILSNELEEVILVFVLFALNDLESYEYAKTLIGFIKHNITNNKDLSVILVGNKYDVGEKDKNEIKVTKKEVHQFFGGADNFFYTEISCKTGYNIDKIKKVIDEIEVAEEEPEDIGVLTEEERQKKVKESDQSCNIY